MAKKFHTEWAFEPFMDDMTFETRHMFGCRSAYVGGKIVMCLAENADEPNWCGILLPTEREHHKSLMAEFPDLQPHAILGKWLYLPQTADEFEQVAMRVGQLIARNDERFGSIPKPKKKRKSKIKQAKKKRHD